jgi:hypothetical protein
MICDRLVASVLLGEPGEVRSPFDLDGLDAVFMAMFGKDSRSAGDLYMDRWLSSQ